MGLWELNSNRTLRNLFMDQNPRDSQARTLFRRSDGSVLLLGRSPRATDVESYEERDPQRVISNSGRLWVSFSTRRTDDAVVISLDSALREQSRVTLRAGSDLWITGAVSATDHLWLYGAFGNQAAMSSQQTIERVRRRPQPIMPDAHHLHGPAPQQALALNQRRFVIGLLGKDLYPLSAIVQAMRKTQQTSLYLERLGPFLVGRAVWQAPL